MKGALHWFTIPLTEYLTPSHIATILWLGELGAQGTRSTDGFWERPMNYPSAAQLDVARRKFDSEWGGVDEVLYGVCRAYPGHSTRRDVMAKVALIGRAYASGVERCVTPPKGEQAIVLVGNYLHEHGGEVDDIIATIREAAEPLSALGMRLIVRQHGRLTALLRSMPHCQRSPRSFAAKYLHFHHPAVPIFDGYATERLTEMVPWSGDDVAFDRPSQGDEEYWQ
jgi:hypothetical protein